MIVMYFFISNLDKFRKLARLSSGSVRLDWGGHPIAYPGPADEPRVPLNWVDLPQPTRAQRICKVTLNLDRYDALLSFSECEQSYFTKFSKKGLLETQTEDELSEIIFKNPRALDRAYWSISRINIALDCP
jgi:hypothetical protein